MSLSVWQENSGIPRFKALNGSIKTDVLVVGGGLCGILCAYFLKQRGVNCVVAEADRIAGGATKNTTAKITSLHGLLYQKLIHDVGIEKARIYFEANEAAVLKYRELSRKIDCGFEDSDAYTYSLDDRGKIEAEVRAINSIGGKAELSLNIPLPFETAGAVRLPDQAQFNPLQFIAGIVKELDIYENTFVRKIDGNKALADNGTITADKIIVATHFPFINTHGAYFLKLYQKRSYVIALEGAEDVGGMYIDEAENGLSFRNYNGLLFIGGGGHRTGKQGGNWKELRDFAHRYYPEAREKYYWSAQDTMSLDGIPYIGRYGGFTKNLYVASGFNKWGITSSMASAALLSDIVTGKENPAAEVFSPMRSILKPQLFINGAEAVGNLLTPTPKRCPHMGCALKWNKAEHTWDCPCHGSRFAKDGNLIDNPAKRNANI